MRLPFLTRVVTFLLKPEPEVAVSYNIVDILVEAGAGVIFQYIATTVHPTEHPRYHISKSLVDALTADLGSQVRDHS